MNKLPRKANKVFISHAWEDKELARNLENQLKAAGIEVWVDHSDVRGGEVFPERISDALAWCNSLVLLWSKAARKSNWVKREWTAAMELDKIIIPCIVDTTVLPHILRSASYVDFQDFAAGMPRLLHALEVLQLPNTTDDAKFNQELAKFLIEEGEHYLGILELDKAYAKFETMKELENAKACLKQILQLEPNSVRHHIKWVELIQKEENRKLQASVLLKLANALYSSGDLKQAEDHYNRVLDLDGEDQVAKAALSEIATLEKKVVDINQIQRKRRRLKSYTGLHSFRPIIFFPESVNEVRVVLAWAKNEKRKITFRAGGHSFDMQALNDDVVVDLIRLNKIKSIDVEKRQITVEGGVRWGNIVRALLPKGLTPYNVVNTKKATAAGTLSGNCFSKFSCIYGREGHQIQSFKLLTVHGDLIVCSRKQNAKIFHAVIGGLGYLGAVTEITYNLLNIGHKAQIETILSKHSNAQDLIGAIIEQTQSSNEDYALAANGFVSGLAIKGFIYSSRYTSNKKLKRLFPRKSLFIIMNLLARIAFINRIIWDLFYRVIKEDRRYVDKLMDFNSTGDVHAGAKKLAALFGSTKATIQQTYVIPEVHLMEFFTELGNRLKGHNLTPTLLDVVFVISDDFLLSPNFGLTGYLVDALFDGLNKQQVATLQSQLQVMSRRCQEVGGRVYLVKNVYASAEDLSKMYAQTMSKFLELKKLLDPDFIIRNDFFDKIFANEALRSRKTSQKHE